MKPCNTNSTPASIRSIPVQFVFEREYEAAQTDDPTSLGYLAAQLQRLPVDMRAALGVCADASTDNAGELAVEYYYEIVPAEDYVHAYGYRQEANYELLDVGVSTQRPGYLKQLAEKQSPEIKQSLPEIFDSILDWLYAFFYTEVAPGLAMLHSNSTEPRCYH